LIFPLLVSASASTPPARFVFLLKGGDHITGTIVSENSNTVVVATAWAGELSLPVDQIEVRETLAAAAPTNPAVAVGVTGTAATHPPAPAPKQGWHADARVGMDLIRGAKDREIYYGQLALRYARPLSSDPARFFRNTLEYRVDYAKTDAVKSSDRMYGSDKMDYDIGRDLFVYNFAGAGYDDIRKIVFQFEAGPGAGYRLIRTPAFSANVEGGLNYQSQEREGFDHVEALYGRVAQDLLWKVDTRVTLSQRAALLTRVDAPDEVQLRLEANLGFALARNISLNLTAMEIYDTRPVPGVTPSEFQLRSSIGLGF
jgi:hypothetical protein